MSRVSLRLKRVDESGHHIINSDQTRPRTAVLRISAMAVVEGLHHSQELRHDLQHRLSSLQVIPHPVKGLMALAKYIKPLRDH